MQGSLMPAFDEASLDPSARKHGGNQNSEAAHESIKDHLPQARANVLAVIIQAGDHGATLHDVCQRLVLYPNQASPRITELLNANRIKPIGVRPSPSGKACSVYVAVKN